MKDLEEEMSFENQERAGLWKIGRGWDFQLSTQTEQNDRYESWYIKFWKCMALKTRTVEYVKENCDMTKLGMNGKLERMPGYKCFWSPF